MGHHTPHWSSTGPSRSLHARTHELFRTVDTCTRRAGPGPSGLARPMADDSLAEAIDGGEAIESVSPPAFPCTQEPGCMQIGTRD